MIPLFFICLANDSAKVHFACISKDCLHYPPKVASVLPKSVACKLNERTPARTVGNPYYNYKRTGEFVIGRFKEPPSLGNFEKKISFMDLMVSL